MGFPSIIRANDCGLKLIITGTINDINLFEGGIDIIDR
jgi:hypothetical protein